MQKISRPDDRLEAVAEIPVTPGERKNLRKLRANFLSARTPIQKANAARALSGELMRLRRSAGLL